ASSELVEFTVADDDNMAGGTLFTVNNAGPGNCVGGGCNRGTWTASTSTAIAEWWTPPKPYSHAPAVPFSYRVVARGCPHDGTCHNCAHYGGSATTGSAEPTWRNDTKLFCDNAGVQYMRGPVTNIAATAAFISGTDTTTGGDFGTYYLSSAGIEFTSR